MPIGGESPKIITVPTQPKSQDEQTVQNGSISKESLKLNGNCTPDVKLTPVAKAQESVDLSKSAKSVTDPNLELKQSKTPEHHVEKRRASMKSDYLERQESVACSRRVSVPTNRSTPKKKLECAQHVVAKSELWDTGSQHRCNKAHQKGGSRVSVSQDEGNSILTPNL